MKKAHLFPTVYMLFFCLMVSVAHAVPNLISYQGVLNDHQGTPLSATVNMTFAIYDAETDGTALWNETQSVAIANGLFDVQLGSVQQLPTTLFNEDIRYLGIQVGADPEMVPRQRMTSGGYAIRAQTTPHDHEIRYYSCKAKNTTYSLNSGRNNTVTHAILLIEPNAIQHFVEVKVEYEAEEYTEDNKECSSRITVEIGTLGSETAKVVRQVVSKRDGWYGDTIRGGGTYVFYYEPTEAEKNTGFNVIVKSYHYQSSDTGVSGTFKHYSSYVMGI